MFEERVQELRSAWLYAGVNPAYHREQMERLRWEWPRLYLAVQKLVETEGVKAE